MSQDAYFIANGPLRKIGVGEIGGKASGLVFFQDMLEAEYDPAAFPDVEVRVPAFVVLATDAPLLPHQCERLAQRAGLGVARSGGAGEHSSGDLFIAFATGNRGLSTTDRAAGRAFVRELRALEDAWISPLFWAAIESTEEAIVNALVAAETMIGSSTPSSA